MANRETIDDWLRLAAADVQQRVDLVFSTMPNGPEAGSCWDQAGLTDGAEIVLDYLCHGEPVLALDHLLYIIGETDLVVSESTRQRIEAACHAAGYPAAAFASIRTQE